MALEGVPVRVQLHFRKGLCGCCPTPCEAQRQRLRPWSRSAAACPIGRWDAIPGATDEAETPEEIATEMRRRRQTGYSSPCCRPAEPDAQDATTAAPPAP